MQRILFTASRNALESELYRDPFGVDVIVLSCSDAHCESIGG